MQLTLIFWCTMVWHRKHQPLQLSEGQHLNSSCWSYCCETKGRESTGVWKGWKGHSFLATRYSSTSYSRITTERGIPLTQRGVANSVRFLSGHSRTGGTDPLVAEHAADLNFLVHHGLAPQTPAVAVE